MRSPTRLLASLPLICLSAGCGGGGGGGGGGFGGDAGTQPDAASQLDAGSDGATQSDSGGADSGSSDGGGADTGTQSDAACTPDCSSQVCGGDDGCGSPCQTGSCPGGSCVAGACVCQNLDCIGVCCGTGQVCSAGKCCTPTCAGKQCGTDSTCGTPCGSCAAGVCNAGTCANTCVPTAPMLLARPYRSRRSGLVVDGAGYAHAIYWGDDDAGAANAYRVYHATNASGTWTKETFDTLDQWGADVDADIDANNWIHAGYQGYTSSGGPLRYAQNTGGTWTFEWPKISGSNLRFAAGPDGSAHYITSQSSGGLSYMTNLSGKFVTESAGTGGTGCVLRIDGSSKAHVVCLTGFIDYELRYITNKSGSWVAQDTAVPILKGNEVFGLDFALDSAAKVHVAFTSGNGISYASNASGSWASKVVDAAGDPHPSIAVDKAGKVHVSFPSGNKLRHANNVSGTFTWQDVDTSPSESTSVTRVDAIGRVHILYRVGGLTAVEPHLKYAALCP